ncbi:MAG TPA: hypothetical protein VL173_04040 [Vicinamibacterales bacterium]|jgi:hypothetical protein|nr:hypothetical protein [Vicinamibacterales bacterium]
MQKALLTALGILVCGVALFAQWPKYPVAGVPRDAQGNVMMDAPAPKTPDGHPDLSGTWMHAESGPPRGTGPGRGGARAGGAARGGAPPAAGPRAGAPPAGGAAPAGRPGEPPAAGAPAGGNGNAAFSGGRGGGVQLEPPTERFAYDASGPPVATFFEAGGNMEGGLPYTDWARDLKKARMAVNQKENPDANCLPMGFLQFHQQPQPRKIVQTKDLILIEYEANYGIRHVYMDGRPLPQLGDVQPWWYGYSVGHWDGNDLVVETNNLRGAEDSPNDGWLDVNGSPYSEQVKFTERFRRPTFGHLQIDLTVEDPKAYTKPWTVRVDQRILPDQELIEFVCNENQQFRRKIKID